MFKIKDISEIRDFKLFPTFSIEKEGITIKEALDIFTSYSRYKSNSITGDNFPNIKEDNGKIIISYPSISPNFEEGHNTSIRRAKNDFPSLLKYEFISKKLVYNQDDALYQKLINRFINFDRYELPFDKDNSLQWFKENVSNDVLPLDIFVNGTNTYMETWSRNKKTDIYTVTPYSMNNHYDCSLSNGEYGEISYADLFHAYKTIVEKIPSGSCRFGLLSDNLISSMLSLEPEFFHKIYTDERSLNSSAIKFYNIKGKSEAYYSFWKEILKREELQKNINNPLLKEKKDDLNLFSYRIFGSCYKYDGYSCWESDIDKVFFSNQELDEDKLIELYKNNYDYEVREFKEVACQPEDFSSIRENEDIFIEVSKNGEYITRPANYMYMELVK